MSATFKSSINPMKTASRNIVSSILLGMVTLLGSASWTPILAQAPLPDMIDQKDNAGWGTFVSFKNGALILKGSAGALGWASVPETTQVFHWDTAARDYKPASPAEALTKVEVGTWVFVAANKAFIRLGVVKEGHVTGTFVSFKDNVTLLLGKDLPVSNFTKKYGNQLKFPKFAENLPVFESIDGGEYTLAGTPSATLPKLKEGTLVTVYFGPADGSFIRVEIGVKR